MTTLRAAPVWVESPAEEYSRLCREITMLQARAAKLLGDVDAGGGHEDEGYLTATALVRDRTGVSAGEAARRVADARGLRRHPEVADAFADASIDLPRVRLLLDAASVAEHLFGRDQAMLIDSVTRLGMRDSVRVVAYWKQAADQVAADANAEHLWQRRHLHVSATLGGVVRIDGELDPDSGQTVITALRSLTDTQNLDASDTRSPAQRRADALVDLCADHLAHGQSPVTGATTAQVSVIVSTHSLEGHSVEPCEYADGTVITPNAARRIACDATITRIVMGPDSMPINVGRATRSIPAATRNALIARDRYCQWSGCERPARWCDAHHIVHWADDGPTNVDNLILLCRRHHRAAHDNAPYPCRE